MATTISTQTHWDHPHTQTTTHTTWNKILTFVDSQSKIKTQWFMISLIVQGVFFLPLPALLSFYYGAPVYILFITLGLFFANIIAGMGGSGIRTLFGLLVASAAINLLMTLIYII